jgi:hypothetical protein
MVPSSRVPKQRAEYKAYPDETREKRPFKFGDPLEYRVLRLYVHMGFFARRGRELYTVGRLDTATDLDVLAIRYSEPLSREVRIAECKTAGGEGPLDRIFWLSGVKKYVEADFATLIRPATKWNIKNFATEVGVELFDLPHVDELERSLGIDPSLWLGSSDLSYFIAQSDEWNRALLRDANLKEIFQTLSGEVRFHDPFGGISFLLHHLRALSRELRERRFTSESLTKFLISESVAQLSMFLMRVSELTLGLSVTDRAAFIVKGMTYGHMDKPLVDRLFRNAQRITTELIKHHTGREILVDDSLFRMPQPPYVKEVQSLVESLVARPPIATSFGPITDLLVFERFVRQREGIDWLPKIFPYTNLRERVALVQDYLKVLQAIEAIPEGVFGNRKDSPHQTPARAETPKTANAAEEKRDGDSADKNTQAPGKTVDAPLFDKPQ